MFVCISLNDCNTQVYLFIKTTVAQLWRFDKVDGFELIYADAMNSEPSANGPGARWRPALWLSPDVDSLYLYGGGKDEPIGNSYSDLWQYSISTEQWTLRYAGGNQSFPCM